MILWLAYFAFAVPSSLAEPTVLQLTYPGNCPDLNNECVYEHELSEGVTKVILMLYFTK